MPKIDFAAGDSQFRPMLTVSQILNNVRALQEALPTYVQAQPPIHRPCVLYIGCVDARLDPIVDIGIPKGSALIFRNIAARVVMDKRAADKMTAQDISPSGEIAESVSIGATLEFFLDHIPAGEDGKKMIVVAGHTDCGGLKAKLNNSATAQDHYLPRYLTCLDGVLEKTRAECKDHANLLHAFTQQSVRQHVKNLYSYPSVQRALQAGMLSVQGWVINTATGGILQMNAETGEFKSISPRG